MKGDYEELLQELEEWKTIANTELKATQREKEENQRLRERLKEAESVIKHYADEMLYFPRNIVLFAQEHNIRLAPIYSDFGETARSFLSESQKGE